MNILGLLGACLLSSVSALNVPSRASSYNDTKSLSTYIEPIYDSNDNFVGQYYKFQTDISEYLYDDADLPVLLCCIYDLDTFELSYAGGGYNDYIYADLSDFKNLLLDASDGHDNYMGVFLYKKTFADYDEISYFKFLHFKSDFHVTDSNSLYFFPRCAITYETSRSEHLLNRSISTVLFNVLGDNIDFVYSPLQEQYTHVVVNQDMALMFSAVGSSLPNYEFNHEFMFFLNAEVVQYDEYTNFDDDFVLKLYADLETLIGADGTNGYNNGYGDGYTAGYNQGYDVGYDDGYVEGGSDSSDDWYQLGHSDGYEQGYLAGYDTGVEDSSEYTFTKLFGAIADTPILIIRNLFNFDLFGVNVMTVVLSLFTALIVFYLIRKLL